MKKTFKKNMTAIVLSVLLTAAAGAGLAYAAWSAAQTISGNTISTKNVTLTSIGGTAFSAEDLIPYDQPDGVTGSKFLSKTLTVTLGDDMAEYVVKLNVSGGTLTTGKIYWKVSADAAVTQAPDTLSGWTPLTSGATVITGDSGGTYYLALILVSEDVADAGKTINFTLDLLEAGE
jgi:hypothetical protein